MKTLTQWVLCSFIAVAALCHPTSYASQYDSELNGMWRGELEIQDGVSLTIGLSIKDGHLTLDSPNQGMFEHKPTEFSLSKNTVSFSDKSLSASYEGELNGGTLEGTFKQGKSFDLDMHKLTKSDKARLKHEAIYAGKLTVTDTSTLPLRVNVAVVHNGYIGTLDSPAQQSYGIPLTELIINDNKLSFESPMLQASFSGELTEDGYTGTFTQGKDFPLTLKKLEDEDKQASTDTPELGEHGASVAVITPEKIEKKFYGDHDDNTLYEIGSVTKTMVGYLLAAASINENLDLNTPINKFWSKAPTEVTLKDLAVHHSGLPRLPENLFDKADQSDPYAHFDEAMLESALANASVAEKAYEYSNFGYGVLAETLAKHSGTSFEDLVQTQIFKPFGMNDSYVALNSDYKPETLTPGHNVLGEPVAHWHFKALAGAGAVVSTPSDMTRYIQTLMGKVKNNDKAVTTLLTSRKTIEGCCQQALSWMISEDNSGKPYAWHNGQTAGFSSFVGFYLDGSKGVVVLNAQSVNVNSDALTLLTETSKN